jgi:phospholipase C
LVVASPWSRGGSVCSKVFDHTSVLQFLEKLLSHKTGKPVRETNISAWRRTVCGDLSSVFRPATAGPDKLTFTEREAVIEGIHKAQFKKSPSGYRKLAASEIAEFRRDRQAAPWMPRQEKGVRPSLPLPYELYADGRLSSDGRLLEISMQAGNAVFGARSAGSPFHAYAPKQFRGSAELRTRAYAVEPGKRVQDAWEIDGFVNGVYHLCVCGPNGFLREFAGRQGDPEMDVRCEYTRTTPADLTGDLTVVVVNRHTKSSYAVELVDHMYQGKSNQLTVAPGKEKSLQLGLAKSFSWYDFTIRVTASETYLRRCAGRVETGMIGFSDPVMGRLG